MVLICSIVKKSARHNLRVAGDAYEGKPCCLDRSVDLLGGWKLEGLGGLALESGLNAEELVVIKACRKMPEVMNDGTEGQSDNGE